MNTGTGEYVQLELLKENDRPYDWSGGGRHVNASKKLGAALWEKGSGYTRNDKLVYGYYLFNSPPGDEPLRQSFREIGGSLELRPTAVGKSVGNLNRGGFLLETEKVGRVKFYRLNSRAAYDGPSGQQRRATEHARHPVTTCPPEKKEEETS
ncbi:transcriptional regulator [Streptomyces violascens]|uniref:transcriptional regulator n=1 Tax=Streptomyces violascens TaxID=67381 RepID=UPI0016747EB6|nr:transcriptional regulator [Streptomyces violascens]